MDTHNNIDTFADRLLQTAYDAVEGDVSTELSLAAVAELADLDNGSAQAALEYLYSRNLARPHEKPGIFILSEYGVAAVELERKAPEVHRALNDLAVAVHACEALDEQTRADLRGNIEALHCQLRHPEPDKELLQRLWESIERLAGPATDEIEAALRAIQTYGWFLR